MAIPLEIILSARDTASDVVADATDSMSSLKGLAGPAGIALAAVGTALGAVSAVAFDLASDVDQMTRDIQANLGVTAEEAENLGEVAKRVWADNFAGSVAEAGAAVAETRRQLGELSEVDLMEVVEDAFRLQDTFDVDLSESINATKALMDEMALSGEEAMDLIATGLQKIPADDLLDSIREYAPVFADAGFSAEQMFSIMATGTKSGVLGVDKISDAVKEMTVKLNEGGDDVSAAFEQIGLDFDQIRGFVASGDEAWADYFDLIVSGLADIEDPVARSQAQVAIFGTMAEDLGVSFTEGLSSATMALEDMAGATESLDVQYQNFGALFEGVKRQVLLALEPLGAELLNLANAIMPHVSDFMINTLAPAIETTATWLAEKLPVAIQTASDFWTNTLQPAIDTVVSFIQGTVIPLIEELASIFQSNSDEMSETASSTWSSIQEVVNAVLTELHDFIDLIVQQWRDIWGENHDEIKAIAETTWQIIQEVITQVTDFVLAVIEAFRSDSTGNVSAMHETIMTVVQVAWDTVKIIIDTVLKEVLNILQLTLAILQGDWETAWEEVKEIFQTAWDGITQILETVFPVLVEIVGNIVQSIIDAFRNVDWGSVGRSIIDGITGGVRNAAGGLADAAKGAAGNALDAAKGFLGIRNPATKFIPVGIAMVDGMKVGLQRGSGELANVAIAVVRQTLDEAMQAALEMGAIIGGGGATGIVSPLPLIATGVGAGGISLGMRGAGFSVPGGGVGGGFGNVLLDGGAGGGTGTVLRGGRGGGIGTLILQVDTIIGTDREAVDRFSREVARELKRRGIC